VEFRPYFFPADGQVRKLFSFLQSLFYNRAVPLRRFNLLLPSPETLPNIVNERHALFHRHRSNLIFAQGRHIQRVYPTSSSPPPLPLRQGRHQDFTQFLALTLTQFV